MNDGNDESSDKERGEVDGVPRAVVRTNGEEDNRGDGEKEGEVGKTKFKFRSKFKRGENNGLEES